GAKQERSMLLGRTETAFTLLQHVEPEDLLADQDEIAVDERDRDLVTVGRVAPGARVAGSRQAQVYAIGAPEIPEGELTPRPDDPDVPRREVGIFGHDHVSLGSTDVEEVAERIARAVGSALRDHDETPALHRSYRDGSPSGCCGCG